jgi:hypothetical protein
MLFLFLKEIFKIKETNKAGQVKFSSPLPPFFKILLRDGDRDRRRVF